MSSSTLLRARTSDPTRGLAHFATSLADEREVWADRVRHDPTRRFFERLVATDTHDAWLIGWAPGQSIPAHDHGESAAAVVVVDGALVESRWSLDGDVTTRRVRAGERPLELDSTQVHALANVGPGVATSIHVYSPPLRAMGWFDGDPLGEAARREEAVVDEESHARTIDTLLADARARLQRVGPHDAHDAVRFGALLVDIRPESNRQAEGGLPEAVVIERNVLEWRLDPASPHRIPELVDREQTVIVVCNEGYASSLAAATLQDLGLVNATDLDGGFRAWKDAGLPTVAPS